MTRSFDLASVKDPRVLVRVVIGTLLLANLVAAVIAFKPFGGSAEDLRRNLVSSQRQLNTMQVRLAATKRKVDKVEGARRDGDRFLARFVMDRRTTFSTLDEELHRIADAAGIKMLPSSNDPEPIEGSNTLGMVSVAAGYEGTYAALTKFMNLVDKSPRFLIIESMQASPQQNSQLLTVQMKIHAFYNDPSGAAL